MSLRDGIIVRRIVIPVLIVVGLLFGVSGGKLYAAAISQGFHADQKLTPGAIVSTDTKASNTIVYANVNNANQLVGVVVGNDTTTIAVSNSANETQVAINGVVNVLVTNKDGNIALGDRIAPSNVAGVGTKALSDGRIVGVAEGAFNGSGTRTVERTVGKNKVIIGTIPVLLSVSSYVAPASSALNAFVPQALQDVAQTVAGGHQVSALKTLLSLAALVLGIGSATVILYGAIRAGLISIGRNPLSSSEIKHNLLQVSVVGLTILTLSIVVAYFTLIW